jgi:anti-anti-sigma regulatory factor
MPGLQRVLGEILARGPERLVFDLSETSFIDCACARALVAVGRMLPGGMPVIRRATPAVRRVLELTGLSACCHLREITGVMRPAAPGAPRASPVR